MAQSKKDLDHIRNVTMYRIHSIFPASAVGSKDPISKRHMIGKDGQ